MNTATPKTIPEYLDQLRYELRNADPALLQDALYDAEEYLRSELAENPSATEAEMLARIATSYGAPETMEYDGAGRQTLVRNALGEEVRTAYDAAGLPRRG